MTKNKQTSKTRLNFSPSVQVLLALGLFVSAVIASRGSGISAWEEVVFRLIYDLPSSLHPFFKVVTQLGSIYMLGLLALIYLLVRRYHIVLRLLMTGSLAYLLSGVAKDMWGRARPHELLTDIVSLDYFRGPGFPSGHMALAVALAFAISYHIPQKYRWLIGLWVILVGLSRIYLGVHAPLDVVGGFAIGWLSYALFRHVRLHDINFIKRDTKKQS